MLRTEDTARHWEAAAMQRRETATLFYRFVLPLLVAVNVGLAVANLLGLQPRRAEAWIQLAAGGFCCLVAGWLVGVAQARAVWRAAAEAQLKRWQRLVEVLLKWLELAPFEASEVSRLKAEAEEALGGDS
jgi:hypothetical protein